MSSLDRRIIVSCIFIGLLAAWGCGDANPEASFDTDEGVHGGGWLPAGHAGQAEININSCKSCHGDDLLGGISLVSCTSCHLGGTMAVHLETVDGVPWLEGLSAGHGLYVVANGINSCRNTSCHGTNLEGVAQSGPACAECHPGQGFI
jgi:hypothetical protein